MKLGPKMGRAYDRARVATHRRAPTLVAGHTASFIELPQGRIRYITAGWSPGGAGERPATKAAIGGPEPIICQRPVVVLAPDPPNGLEHLGPLIDAVAEHHPVLAFEPPGFGWSKPSPDFDGSLIASARLVHDLFDRLGVESAIVAFPCLMGFVAIEAAARDPVRIRACMLSQTPSWEAAQRWVDRVDRGGRLRRPVTGQLALHAAEGRIIDHWYAVAEPDDARRESYLDIARRRRKNGAMFGLASALQGIFSSPGPFVGMHLHPTTVVLWGVEDRTYPEQDADSILLDLPGATVIPLEDAGHFPELTHPEIFLRAIDGIVRELGLRPSGVDARRAQPESLPAAERDAGPARSHIHAADQGFAIDLVPRPERPEHDDRAE